MNEQQRAIVAERNVFVFSWVDNYEQQLKQLTETFESRQLGCGVEIYKNLTSKHLPRAVERIRLLDFRNFQYIAVLIIENKTQEDGRIYTSDNKYFYIESEIMAHIRANKTVYKRFFVVHKLLKMDDDSNTFPKKDAYRFNNEVYNSLRIPNELRFELYAYEDDGNFADSPFVDTLCEQLRRHATTMDVIEIFRAIKRQVQQDLRYQKLEFEITSNRRREENGTLGYGRWQHHQAVCLDDSMK